MPSYLGGFDETILLLWSLNCRQVKLSRDIFAEAMISHSIEVHFWKNECLNLRDEATQIGW
jgi:hypothetical protein